MNKSLIKFAVYLLDSQEGIDAESYDMLKHALIDDKSSISNAIVANTTVFQGRAFIEETWIEENAEELEYLEEGE